MDVHDARLYEPLADKKVLCTLCPRDCRVPNNGRGAKRAGCLSISYTFSEPTIFYELAYDTAELARAQGLKNNFVDNRFISEGPLRRIAPLLDAINIDIKLFRDESYRRISGARLQPVLDAIRLYHELGV